MKNALSICWLLTVTVLLPGSSQQAPSLSDGVYTDQQATRGKTQYVDHCSRCHQAELQGSDLAPALKGDDFLLKLSGLRLQDVFNNIATTMPGDAPGTLTPQVNADILAYMLQVNEFPAGQTELTPDAAALKAIAIKMKKP